LVDSNNALIAQLYPQGNNLGRVTTSYYKHNGAVRQDAGGRYYMDRNLTITVGRQPVTPYNLRFPYQNSELNALIAQPGSGVTSQFDLVMTKNGDGCLNAIGAGGTGGVVFFPTGFGSISGDRFIDVTNITGGFSSFYLHGGSTPIPVNLVDFKVQRSGKVNNVSWSTTQEVNTSHFVIERSNDGRNFAEIGRVTANGNSNALLNYGFVDNNPVKGINYYRLRVVDRDNTAKLSAIRSVRNEGIADVAVFPNPVTDLMTVTIDADKAETGAMVITDITGKIVFNKTITVAQGNNRLPVNTASLASGAYIIKVQLSNDIVVRKFNKQ
jgi:trimeric autotransporter adhesin